LSREVHSSGETEALFASVDEHPGGSGPLGQSKSNHTIQPDGAYFPRLLGDPDGKGRLIDE